MGLVEVMGESLPPLLDFLVWRLEEEDFGGNGLIGGCFEIEIPVCEVENGYGFILWNSFGVDVAGDGFHYGLHNFDGVCWFACFFGCGSEYDG